MDANDERINGILLAMGLLQQAAERSDRDVSELRGVVNTLRDDRMRAMERTVTVSEERIDRLQKIVYGVLAMASVQIISFIIGIVLWAIKK